MRTAILSFVLFLSLATSAFAHRLDEYLQAATIAVEADRVAVELRLVPGVAVFPAVVAKIDADADGVISDAEQRDYAARVRRDLSLTVDGRPLALELSSRIFPTLDQMKDGLGDILLKFDAAVPPGRSARKLVFENRHEPQISAYLANSLVPGDSHLSIIDQTRNYEQSVYQLDYSQSAASATIQLSPLGAYFFHGVRHILSGYDHLLFVCALVLAATSLWDLMKVVFAFTLAHTMTLTLAALNLIHVPSAVVEPLIAASIVVIAIQNVFWPRRARGWSRIAAAFFFGLFHGLGFAGGLLDVMREMPTGAMLTAIFAFSIGVEVGHQAVVLPLFALLKAVRDTQPDVVLKTRVSMAFQRIGSAGISLAGVYYLCLALTGRS